MVTCTFLLYLGKDNQTNIEPLGIRVVQNLKTVIPQNESVNHKTFFDNLFRSIDFSKALGDTDLKATSTIRENHTKKCLLISSLAMKFFSLPGIFIPHQVFSYQIKMYTYTSFLN